MVKLFRLQDWYLGLGQGKRGGKAKGVILLSSGGLGDTVLFALILPRLLSIAEPGERVSVILRSDAAKMAFLFPPEVSLITVDFKRLRKDLGYRRKTCEKLFHGNYRIAVSCDYLRHPDLDEALLDACRAPLTLAMEPRPWPKYDSRLKRNRKYYTRLFDSGPPVLDKVVRWSRFCDWLTGNEISPPRLRIEYPQPPTTSGTNPEPYVIIQPFSAVKQKQSQPDLYRKIIKSLPDHYRVVVTGTVDDLEKNPDFRELLEMPGVDFDSSTFKELVPALIAASLVISVDTALMHLSAAMGTTTLCIASAAYVGEIVPYDHSVTPANAHFIYHSMPCEGCLGSCPIPEEEDMFPCVARLDEKVIIDKVRKLIGREDKVT